MDLHDEEETGPEAYQIAVMILTHLILFFSVVFLVLALLYYMPYLVIVVLLGLIAWILLATLYQDCIKKK